MNSLKLFDRTFQRVLSPVGGIPLRVLRYSWHCMGGPLSATLRAYGNQYQIIELARLLRYAVTVTDEQGRDVWWGFINSVDIYSGRQVLSVSLNDMWNNITVQYTGENLSRSCPAATSALSVSTYGTKELKAPGTNLDNNTAAVAYRDQLLAYYALPRVNRGYSQTPAGTYAEITCAGWFQTLNWRYFSDADTTQTASSTQIGAIVTAVGSLLAGTETVPASGINTAEYRDGAGRAGDEIYQLFELGVSGGNRYNAKVRDSRYLSVWQEYSRGANDYRIDSRGELRDANSAYVPYHTCPVGVWVIDTHSGLSSANSRLLSDPGAFFVEEAEFDVTSGIYTPRPRGINSPAEVGRVLIA